MGYARVAQDLSQFKACLKNGYPFVFGFAVLSSFQTAEVARTGKMVMPQANDQQLGGHAVTAVGYDDFKECFIVRNSWGEGWGDKGYFYMPYQYISHPMLAQDFWAINWVEGFKNTKVASIRGPSAPDMNVQSMRTIHEVRVEDRTCLTTAISVLLSTRWMRQAHITKKSGGAPRRPWTCGRMNGGFPIFNQGHSGQLHSECLGGCLPLHAPQDDCGER